MNPLTNIRSRQKQREQEVINGVPESASYHSDYRNSAYIYAGQLSFNLTEGDLLAIFSQCGEIVDVNLVRDKNTRKSRGFAFLAYEDQRSTDLAVDNLNGITVDGRIISVDHVKDYKRLVDNPDYVDTRAQQTNDSNVTAEAHQTQRPSDHILSGAEAEAIEDELGTSGVADPARPAHTSSHSTGQRAPAPGAGGSSIAEMLREVEAYVGDWRSRSTGDVSVAKSRNERTDTADPMANYLATDKLQKGDRKSKHRHKHKENKEKAVKTKSRHHRDRSRSRSPRPRDRRSDSDRDSKGTGSRHNRTVQKDRHRAEDR